jgi:hypothetical protein
MHFSILHLNAIFIHVKLRAYHYRNRSLCRELKSVSRARSQTHGTGLLCRESGHATVQTIYTRGNRAGSRHRWRLTAQRLYVEGYRSRLSAQRRAHGTTWWPLARPSNVSRAEPQALGKEFLAECFTKALGKGIKKQFQTSKLFASSTYTHTKNMLKFHINIDMYVVSNNFISL